MRAPINLPRAIAFAACGLAISLGAPAAAQDAPDLSGLPEAYQGADVAAGAQLWLTRTCATCHQINDGNTHGLGPDLFGIFGKTAGSNESFLPRYSPAMRESDMVWDIETLDAWITSPFEVMPRTTMAFPQGVRDEQERINLLAYLWVQTGAAEAAASAPADGGDTDAAGEE